MATKTTADNQAYVGTGLDPLGRYPKGSVHVSADPAEYAEAVDKGYLVFKDTGAEIEAAKTLAMTGLHTPEESSSGAIRADRAFSPEEAKAIDDANRARYVEQRENRHFRQRLNGF